MSARTLPVTRVELLTNEFKNLQAWAESFVDALNSMRAVELTTSEHALDNDPDAQKITSCGQFLEAAKASCTPSMQECSAQPLYRLFQNLSR